MDAAKRAIAEHTSQRGHTTDVDEIVHTGITSETIKPHRHEETTQAVNREVHQHHHHTTVQPISHKEVLPEKHSHNLLPVVSSEHIHGDPKEHESRLASMKAAFKDSSVTHEHTHSASTVQPVVGEHVHHHVHEIVQPIIHKETHQPEVVHTTQPIHEVHHHHATHHGMSALPMKTLDEFKKAGGILTGSRSSTHETYDGEPRPYNKDLETSMDKLGLNGHHGESGLSNTTSTTSPRAMETSAGTNTNYRDNSSSITTPQSAGHQGLTTPSRSSEQYGNNSTRDSPSYGSPTSTSGGYATGGTGTGSGGAGLGTSAQRTSTEVSGSRASMDSEGRKKPSLMSRLNPLTDSDGDGKKGFMR